jgi:prepilin-type N-terminal cleavage/methylation domain-containing protein
MKQNKLNIKKLKGFTLIELIIVVVLLGILASQVLPNLTSDRNSIEYGAVNTMIVERFPTAITKYAQRKNGVCTALTKALLEKRGIQPSTAWKDAWTLTSTANVVTVVMPISGSPDKAVDGPDLVASATADVRVASAAFATPKITLTYPCK